MTGTVSMATTAASTASTPKQVSAARKSNVIHADESPKEHTGTLCDWREQMSPDCDSSGTPSTTATAAHPSMSVVAPAIHCQRPVVFEPTLSCHHLAWLRAHWPHRLLVKGILSAQNARQAVDHGADGVVVSNHGGRQLDRAPATLRMRPEIREELAPFLRFLRLCRWGGPVHLAGSEGRSWP